MGLPAELFGGRGPTRWRKVSDTVAGFLRADGKLAPIYAERPRKFDDILEIKYHKLQLRLLFLCYYGRKLDDKNARKLGDY